MAAAEQKKEYHVSKAFRGLNTKANRTGIQDDEFSWIENAQPIGSGNIKIIAAPRQVVNSNGNVVTFSGNVTSMVSNSLGANTYISTFQDNGASQFFDVNNLTLSNIAVAGTFTNTGVRTAQWNNSQIIIADPQKGLYVWNGSNTTVLGSVGAIGITLPGSGYSTAPSVTISAPDDSNGVQATAQATVSGGIVTKITLTEPGTGYTSSPTVTLSGVGSGAQAAAAVVTFATGTIYLALNSGGTGYTNSATITISFSGGGGSNAAANAIVSNGIINQVILTNAGTGYTSPPTVTVTDSGGGSNAIITAYVQSNAVTDVVSYSGRIWVSQGRTVTYTAAGSYNDFTGVSSGSVFLPDATLHGTILSMLSANDFLYIFGDDSINIFSNVNVTTSGSTLFTNTNLSASVGSRLSDAIFPYFRYVMMMNDFGVYGVIGSSTVKLSDSLDGIFPLIDFTKPVSGGQVLINNILCAAFSFYANNLTVGGSRVIQAVFFDKKWFLTSQGNLTYITNAPVGGKLEIFGTTGKDLYQLYNSANAAVSSTVQTALWMLGDPIRDKQALKWGVEATLTLGATLNLTVDSENNSSPIYVISNTLGWTNNSGTTIPWVNIYGTTINWTSLGNGYYLYRSDAQQWGKYLGYTITSNSPAYTYNTFELEYEKRARF
jgi:hypothetical protein